MDIAGLVEYEREFPLDLRLAGKKVGVRFMIKAINCEAATAVVMRQNAAAVLGDDDSSASDRSQLDIYAACISAWDWGDNEFGEGKGAPEYSAENARMVLKHPSSKWMVPQIVEAAQNIENFTNDWPPSS